jgi:hypothetical protein
LASPVAGRAFYLSRLRGTPPAEAWAGSPSDTLHHVLAPIASYALAPALVWALGAVLLPHAVRGRPVALDCVRVTIWALVLTTATTLTIAATRGSGTLPMASTAIAGGVAAAGLGLAGAWLARVASGGGEGRHPAGRREQFP